VINDYSGCELWYTDNGYNWSQLVGNKTIECVNTMKSGFGNKYNIGIRAMHIFNNSIYLGTINSKNGLELWSISKNT
jgi:hypothetical protein